LLELWQTYDWTVIFVTHSVFESVFLSNRIVVMSPNPGRVFQEIDVTAGYPRDELFRTSPVYSANCRIASDALEAAMKIGPQSFGAHL
jgi:NitT/TauT family transport system ATP-binding protein